MALEVKLYLECSKCHTALKAEHIIDRDIVEVQPCNEGLAEAERTGADIESRAGA